MIEYATRISNFLQTAYKSARNKKECLEYLRQMPSLQKWFSAGEQRQRIGYTSALCDVVPDQTFWLASFDHGSSNSDTYVIRDPKAVEEYILSHFPEVVVQDVLES
jgi:hypothetical protein